MWQQTLQSLPAMSWADKLAYLVVHLSKVAQADTPVTHILVGDKYIREMRIPADTLFIGRTHLNGHIVKLASGSVLNVSEEGTVQIDAPYEFKSEPGYQAVFYTLTDVVGLTVHDNPDGVTDTKLLEDRDFERLTTLLERGQEVQQRLLTAEAA